MNINILCCSHDTCVLLLKKILRFTLVSQINAPSHYFTSIAILNTSSVLFTIVSGDS